MLDGSLCVCVVREPARTRAVWEGGDTCMECNQDNVV